MTRPAGPLSAVRVSLASDEALRDLETAWCSLFAAKDKEQRDQAYDILCHRRDILWRRIEDLEQRLDIERRVTRHFT